MVEASPPSAFVVTEADLLLEFLVVPFDAPSELGLVDKVGQHCVRWQGREPVFDRFALALWPFDQEPFLGAWCRAPIIPICRPEAHGGKA